MTDIMLRKVSQLKNKIYVLKNGGARIYIYIRYMWYISMYWKYKIKWNKKKVFMENRSRRGYKRDGETSIRLARRWARKRPRK